VVQTVQHRNGKKPAAQWPPVQPTPDQDPLSRSAPDERGRGCTSRQTKTHITEKREICYPWHACYGQLVLIRKSNVRCDKAIFWCSIWRDGAQRSMEVPQWMFDRAVCCTMRLADGPVVSCSALLELKELLQGAAVTADPAVIQTQQ